MVNVLTILLNDPIGLIALVALVFIYGTFPQAFSIMMAIKKKRSFIIEFRKDGVFDIRQAIYKNNLWKALTGGEHTETFQSRPDYTGWLFGQPAIATYSTESSSVPVKELVLLRHLQEHFGIYSYGELRATMSELDTKQEAMRAEIEAQLKIPDNIEQMEEEQASKKLKDIKETVTYKELTDYHNTAIYNSMTPKARKIYDDFTAIQDTGLFLKHVEVVRFSDIEKFLKKHHDPRTIRINEMNEVALERAKHADGGGLGGLGGKLDIKTIAIVIAFIIIAYTILPSMMGSTSSMASGAAAVSSGMSGATTQFTAVP